MPPIPTGGAQKRGAAVVLRRRPRRVRFIANDFFVDVSEVLSGTTGMDFPFETVFAESACEAEGRVTTPMNMHGASSPDGDSRKTSRGEMFFRVHRSCMQDGPPREGNSTAASLAAFPCASIDRCIDLQRYGIILRGWQKGNRLDRARRK